MFKNFFLVTFRNMGRNKLFTLINILGLSTSIACCVLILMYVTREFSYDQQNKNVYRLTGLMNRMGFVFRIPASPGPIVPLIRQNIPEVAQATRILNTDNFRSKNIISYRDFSFYAQNVYFVDSSFFNVLQYDIIKGNKNHPFANISSIVLEKNWAQKIFGNENPIGKIVHIRTSITDEGDFAVSAVYDKNGSLCHLNPSIIIPLENPVLSTYYYKEFDEWFVNSYLKLEPGSNVKSITEKLNNLVFKYWGNRMKDLGSYTDIKIQPVQDIHVEKEKLGGVKGVVSITFIRVLMLIGILILILACVNYINLSTARAGNRSLEVGLRKVMGFSRRELILQFLGESFIVVFISLLLSLVFSQIALPYFNRLINDPLVISADNIIALGIFLFGFLMITGFLAGLYPALFLSSFKPALVLKGNNRNSYGISILRQGLIVLQFIISIALISAILVISKQVNFIKNAELGYDQNSKLIVPLNTNEAEEQYEVLKQKFDINSDIQEVSGVVSVPGLSVGRGDMTFGEGQNIKDAILIRKNFTDTNYFSLMGIKLLSGRFFRYNDFKINNRIGNVILSVEAVKQLGYKPDDAIGRHIYHDIGGNDIVKDNIIGVVEDIHQTSFHHAINPVMYKPLYRMKGNYACSNLIMRVNMERFPDLISRLQAQWKEILWDVPFTYYTLDDHLMIQYARDFSTYHLIQFFAVISVIISCMGLYALSLFMAERRFREIGIRKVFGAGTRNILLMVSSDLSKLILVAFIISIPVSVWAMNRWLETFVYRIQQGPEIYMLAGIISLAIGGFTISFQSIRAALTNPVKVLQEE